MGGKTEYKVGRISDYQNSKIRNTIFGSFNISQKDLGIIFRLLFRKYNTF